MTSSRFHPKLDILLLKEVVADAPYLLPFHERASKWEAIVKRMNNMKGVQITIRGAKDRFKVLQRARKQGELKNLKSSGTEEEYGEREQLLTEIVGMITEETTINQKEKQSKAEDEKRKEKQGREIRQAAMQSLKKLPEDDELQPKPKSRKSSNDMSDYLKLRKEQLDLERERFELEKKEREARMQHDVSMIALINQLINKKNED